MMGRVDFCVVEWS